MRVGINGMGRIGRLALRAALGAAERGDDDPRRANRLEVVHLKRDQGAAPPPQRIFSSSTPYRAVGAPTSPRRAMTRFGSMIGSLDFPHSPPQPTFPGVTLVSMSCSNAVESF